MMSNPVFSFVEKIKIPNSCTYFSADFCLAHLLVQHHPTMFFSHFVECLFHFNSYEDHNGKVAERIKETELTFRNAS